MLSRVQSAFSLFLLLSALLCARAQEPTAAPAQKAQIPQAAPDDANLPMHTLHVYMDLIQVPVLVLDSQRGRMKPIDPAKFQVSLDAGPSFRPRRVRQQGDDPISLAILLDPDSQPYLMTRLDEAIGSLAPESLHPNDRVSLYTANCGQLRSIENVAGDPAMLQHAVAAALDRWNEQRKIKPAKACEKGVQLWDSMYWMARRLANAPGRRVLLAISNGQDRGSKLSWNDLKTFAQGAGIAIFGFAEPSYIVGPWVATSARAGYRNVTSTPYNGSPVGSEDPFTNLCQLTGGLVLASSTSYTHKHLADFVRLVRERYIVEFIRPRNDTPGEHSIEVSIAGHPTAFVRTAGVSITLRDPACEADPDTLPTDTSDAPEMGARKPLRPSKP